MVGMVRCVMAIAPDGCNKLPFKQRGRTVTLTHPEKRCYD